MEELKKLLSAQGLLSGTAFTYDPARLLEMKAATVNETTGDLTGVDCKLCKNRGSIAQIREDRLVMVQCKCMKVRRCVWKMERSGLQNVIRELTFDAYQAREPWQQKIKKGAMAYANEPKGWFLLSGQSGAGKTHLCTAICHKLLQNGRAVRYMSWREEIGKLKALSLDNEARQRLLEEIKQAEVLYIDDLFKAGTEREGANPTAADGSLAFEILNYRDHNRLPTVISTEKTAEELLAIDTAIAGRILYRSGQHAYSIDKDPKKNYRLRNLVSL